MDQLREGLLAEAEHQLLLVLEVQIDGGRGIVDALGDAPHREAVVPLADEQRARGVEDLLPEELLLSCTPVADTHGFTV